MLLRYSSRLLALLLTVHLLFCVCSLAKKPPRPLVTSCTVNETDEDGVILYYVERSVSNDTTSDAGPPSPACTRYAWSTVGYPTLFISHDNSSCECKYDLNEESYTDNQTRGSVNISGVGSYFSLAIVFTRVIEFSVDAKSAKSYTVFNVTDHCNTSNIMSTVELNSSELKWNLTGKALNATMKTNNDSRSDFNFMINTYFPEKEGFKRLPLFPKPQISENATLIDIILQNFPFKPDTSNGTNSSRLALEMLIVHGPRVKSGQSRVQKYLDDEYTPSVFSSWTYNVSGDPQVATDKGGYLHWKPISYEDPSRKSTSSQQIHVLSAGNDSRCTIGDLPAGLVTALFGVNPSNVSNVTRWFAVFGTDGDDTNLLPSYSTWTLVVGYGDVPADNLSFVVIITIIVGLGIPGLLVVAGGVYVFIKKKPWQTCLAGKRSSYETLK